ncbi:FidL-like membrane protein [Kosakonia sp. BK9b]
MNRSGGLILLLLSFTLAILTSGWLYYSHSLRHALKCVGVVEWNVGNKRFDGTVSYQMGNGKGVAVITGKLTGQTVSDINRSIYFHYNGDHQTRVLSNDKIAKTFADTADEVDIKATLPGFYRTPNRELSMTIEEYEGAYLISTSNVPSLYCRKPK